MIDSRFVMQLVIPSATKNLLYSLIGRFPIHGCANSYRELVFILAFCTQRFAPSPTWQRLTKAIFCSPYKTYSVPAFFQNTLGLGISLNYRYPSFILFTMLFFQFTHLLSFSGGKKQSSSTFLNREVITWLTESELWVMVAM
jgi:hypothetical protein